MRVAALHDVEIFMKPTTVYQIRDNKVVEISARKGKKYIYAAPPGKHEMKFQKDLDTPGLWETVEEWGDNKFEKVYDTLEGIYLAQSGQKLKTAIDDFFKDIKRDIFNSPKITEPELIESHINEIQDKLNYYKKCLDVYSK